MRLALSCLAIVLASCAGVRERTVGEEFTRAPKSATVSVQLVFGTPAETMDRCNEVNGNRYLLGGPPACVVIRKQQPSTIYVATPKNWRDEPPICQLGHEVLHLTGAEH